MDNIEKMKYLFEYFEDAQEAVYISDIDTHELIYMNACLRKKLGYAEHKDYRGLFCYKVLQNMNKPCTFCNNENIITGGFVTWAHDNPVLNQRFIVRDKMVECDGHRYRIETADGMNYSKLKEIEYHFTRRESVLNECLQLFFVTPDPDKSLDMVLRYLGQIFMGCRTYIFENSDTTTTNTYEWCAEGITPQIEILRDLPLSDIGYWLESFTKTGTVVIQNIEDIKKDYPSTYSLLKPRGINSLVAGPIMENGKLMGFIGIDNPAEESVSLLEQVLRELGKYMVSQLKRRELYQRFNRMSYHDVLTGAYNHNAMVEHNMMKKKWRSLGTIYCDINGLKETNDTQGHDAGNKLIQKCYQLMKKQLKTEWIYRVGGDEFVAIYYDVDQEEIKKDVEMMRLAVLQSTCQMSIGLAWTDEQNMDIEKLLSQADAEMYREKRLYYTMNQDLDMEQKLFHTTGEEHTERELDSLRRFLSNSYCDVVFLLNLLGSENNTSYFFFGDMQQNVFYISENMRKKFGFSSSIVPDLIHIWASRITDATLFNQFRDDINGLLERKQDHHDMRYQVEDANGNMVWIRCYGKLQWSSDGEFPLFFAGRMSLQDDDFVVDPLTNFPTETVLKKELSKLCEKKENSQVIVFSLNHFLQINNSYGRGHGDELIRMVMKSLRQIMNRNMMFFRLSGMRFLILMHTCSIEKTEKLIQTMETIIDSCYRESGLMLQNTCSFALLYYPQKQLTPQDFIENAVALIKVARQFPEQLYINEAAGGLQQMHKFMAMEHQLMEDILNGMKNFRIVIQPVVSTETWNPCGGETLLRWKYKGQNVSPATFIPMIEEKHLIHAVGRWVFEQAVHTCVRILTYIPNFYLTVNVSLQQLDDNGFLPFIQDTLKKHRLDGNHIVLELTESCMDNQPEKLDYFVQACKEMNIHIALDDFGSGYSSLRVLLRYPSSIIKLDRSLLLEMTDSYEKIGFITTIVYACHQFGKKVCMEGVETDYQNQLVKEAGCDLIQGYYHYKPMELDDMYYLIANQKEENADLD